MEVFGITKVDEVCVVVVVVVHVYVSAAPLVLTVYCCGEGVCRTGRTL